MNLILQYSEERQRIFRFIRKLEKQGVVVEYKVPSIPKKITQASVNRLQKITEDKILEQSYIYHSNLGKVRGRQILGTIQRKEVETQTQRETRKKAEWDEYYRQWDLKHQTDDLIRKNAEEIQKKAEKVYPIEELQIDIPKHEDVIIENVMDEFDRAGYTYDADTNKLYDALEELDSFQPKTEWGKWYGEKKKQQVEKLMKGINQAIDTAGKSEVARIFNENASTFNATIDKAIYDSGGKDKMADIDTSIDSMINSLMGAMAYEDAEFYGE